MDCAVPRHTNSDRDLFDVILCPESGTNVGEMEIIGQAQGVTDGVPVDLVRHVAASTGLPDAIAARVVADVVGYFDETAEQFVRRRHAELQRRQVRNADIWQRLTSELAQHRVAAPEFTERQLRRIVYG